MRFASEFGFAPGNAPAVNSAALQAAADLGGEIFVDGHGIAEVCEPVRLGSDTTLRFENGLYLRRTESSTPDNNGYVLTNQSAFTAWENGPWDRHIRIIGLRLICNAVHCLSGGVQTEKTVPGLRGMLAFYRVNDLVIEDFETFDLPPEDFAIHVCTFENLRVENVRIEGRKDAVHLGRGSKFVIRHGIFRTFDDPIALNAHDYASSNPELGWIEDGIIEDCWDLDDKDTTGFFCRVLAGSWCDWRSGMQVQHSDTVVYDHKVYRVYMKPDHTVYTSVTPPTHAHGIKEYDGIRWLMVEEGDIYSCGCRNIVFRDIHLQKNRPVAFSLHFDKDNWSRSVYPNSVMPVQSGLTFENIEMSGKIGTFLWAATPVDTVRITRSTLDSTSVRLGNISTEGAEYGRTEIIFDGCTFRGTGDGLVQTHPGRPARVRAYASCPADDFAPTVSGETVIGENDIGLKFFK
ncbi:MAG: hypothetical protein MJ175_00150 [Clostridia bacterium]|nr:hypothetical protein [Clostridia bacterium]